MKAMKFKIGDKVRAVRCNSLECIGAANQVGKIGVIWAVKGPDEAWQTNSSDYAVVIGDGQYGFNEDELEAVSEPGINSVQRAMPNPCVEITLGYPKWVAEMAWNHVFPADFAAVGYEGTKRLWAHLGNGSSAPREVEAVIGLLNRVRNIYRLAIMDVLTDEEGWKLEDFR